MGAGGGGISLSASSRSRSGFSARNFSSSWFNSIVESCSRRIDCCSCGVSVRCCESLSCRVCFIEIRREDLARRIVVQTGQNGNGGYRGKRDRKSTRLNSSHSQISYAVFCLKKKKQNYSYIWHHEDYLNDIQEPLEFEQEQRGCYELADAPDPLVHMT